MLTATLEAEKDEAHCTDESKEAQRDYVCFSTSPRQQVREKGWASARNLNAHYRKKLKSWQGCKRLNKSLGIEVEAKDE